MTKSSLAGALQEAPLVTYFVLDTTVGRMKIGRTINLKRRLEALQNGCGAELMVVGTLAGDLERELHRRFAAARLHGEWFSVHDLQVSSYLRETFGYSPRPTAPPAGVSSTIRPIDAAKFYGVTVRTVQRWAKAGLLEAVPNPGGKLLGFRSIVAKPAAAPKKPRGGAARHKFGVTS